LGKEDLHQRFQLIGRVSGPRRIAGTVENDRLRAGGDGRLELVHGHLEAPGFCSLNHDRGGIHQEDDVGVGDPVGRGNDDLIPGLEKRLSQVIDDELGPGRGKDLRTLVGEAVIPLEFLDDRVLQVRKPRGGSVFGDPLPDGLVGGLLDVVRGVKVRLSLGKADDFNPLGPHGRRLGCRGESGGGFDPVHAVGEFHGNLLSKSSVGATGRSPPLIYDRKYYEYLCLRQG
jgi:hypothetical protein